jgi:hypothetical protein
MFDVYTSLFLQMGLGLISECCEQHARPGILVLATWLAPAHRLWPRWIGLCWCCWQTVGTRPSETITQSVKHAAAGLRKMHQRALIGAQFARGRRRWPVYCSTSLQRQLRIFTLFFNRMEASSPESQNPFSESKESNSTKPKKRAKIPIFQWPDSKPNCKVVAAVTASIQRGL